MKLQKNTYKWNRLHNISRCSLKHTKIAWKWHRILCCFLKKLRLHETISTSVATSINSETELILVLTFEHWLSWIERCFILLGYTLEKIPLPHLWQIGMKRLHLSRWRCCLATWEKGHSCKGSGCVVWRWAESISTWIIRWIYLSGRSSQGKMHSFGYCSNYLPPVPPIRLTCTTCNMGTAPYNLADMAIVANMYDRCYYAHSHSLFCLTAWVYLDFKNIVHIWLAGSYRKWW